MQARHSQSLLTAYEMIFGTYPKNLPHYKYVGIPLYKLLGGKRNPLFSVPVTFAAMDYLFHQVLPRLILNLSTNDQKSLPASFELEIWQNLMWTSVGLPIAFFKYYKNKNAPSTELTSIIIDTPKDEGKIVSQPNFIAKSKLENATNKKNQYGFFCSAQKHKKKKHTKKSLTLSDE